MNRRPSFERLVASLHDAALDDALWPATSNLIDEACDATGNSLIASQGAGDDARTLFARTYDRGQSRQDLNRDYFDNYLHRDERIPRLRQLRRGKLVRVANLYSASERKTSATWNEAMQRYGTRNALNVCLDGPQGSRIFWGIADPVAGDWNSDRIRTVRRLLPHLRSFVHVRQALADATALGSSFVHLLGNARIAVVHLDRHGRIVEANDRARNLLGEDNGLRQEDGLLRARLPEDDTRLGRLLKAALPTRDTPPAGGCMLVRRRVAALGLTLHVHPVTVRQLDMGAAGLGALVLIMAPDVPAHLDAALVESVLGLSHVESRVALWLAEGKTVRDIAVASGRAESSIRTYLRRIHRKLGVSRRADLVRLVLSVPERAGLRPRR